jgi:glycosyltransferase involved in cell wall biosynthesis
MTAQVLASLAVEREMIPVFLEPSVPPSQDHVVVVVPALNEDANIGRVVRDLRSAGYECLVVDDGSSDGTAAVARREGATVLSHLISLGQGAALQTGIDRALASGAQTIVTFDGDGQHRVADIERLLDALHRGAADFALGSRFLGASVNQPSSRRLLLVVAIWFTRLSTGLHLTDTHNGLRAMTRRGASAIRLRQNRMAHASEILHQIRRSRLPWVEVPVTIEYTEYSLAKGQRSVGLVAILADLLMDALDR